MINRTELERVIKECENGDVSYSNYEKLATFYTIYDHLYASRQVSDVRDEIVIGNHGNSDFLEAIAEKRAESIWRVIDELMDTLQITNPHLYDGVMRKIAE